jgi:hypothetical protein
MKVGAKWAEGGRYAHFDMVETWSVADIARAAPGRWCARSAVRSKQPSENIAVASQAHRTGLVCRLQMTSPHWKAIRRAHPPKTVELAPGV